MAWGGEEREGEEQRNGKEKKKRFNKMITIENNISNLGGNKKEKGIIIAQSSIIFLNEFWRFVATFSIIESFFIKFPIPNLF